MAVPCLGLCPFIAKGSGSIPGEGTKILQARQHGQRKKEKKWASFLAITQGWFTDGVPCRRNLRPLFTQPECPLPHLSSPFQDNPISTKVFQRQSYPPPRPVSLLQADPSAGHHGLRNIWVPSAKPHLCSPELLRPWIALLPGAATMFPRSRAPDLSALAFFVWVPGLGTLLEAAFAHLGYQPVAILFSLHLSYFCVMQMYNQLYSGWMGWDGNRI